MTKKEKIKEALENMDVYNLVTIHNEYCGNVNSDNYIYLMDEFDEIMSGQEPWEIARSVFYGDFCPAKDFFRFNGYGNLESTDYPMDYIDITDIADYITENDDALENDDIQEILDEYEAIEGRAAAETAFDSRLEG